MIEESIEEFIARYDPCNPDKLRLFATMDEAWEAETSPSNLMWAVVKLRPSKWRALLASVLTKFALPAWEAAYPDDRRVRDAVEACWLGDAATANAASATTFHLAYGPDYQPIAGAWPAEAATHAAFAAANDDADSAAFAVSTLVINDDIGLVIARHIKARWLKREDAYVAESKKWIAATGGSLTCAAGTETREIRHDRQGEAWVHETFRVTCRHRSGRPGILSTNRNKTMNNVKHTLPFRSGHPLGELVSLNGKFLGVVIDPAAVLVIRKEGVFEVETCTPLRTQEDFDRFNESAPDPISRPYTVLSREYFLPIRSAGGDLDTFGWHNILNLHSYYESQNARAKAQMTLGGLLLALYVDQHKLKDTEFPRITPHSYRGHHADLAFDVDYDEKIRFSEFLAVCADCQGKPFECHGGYYWYVMGRSTPIWLAREGGCGTAVSDFVDGDFTLCQGH